MELRNEKDFIKSREILEIECQIIENLLRWQTIPTYVYLSALSGLIWALTNIPIPDSNLYINIFISSFLISKILWALFNSNFSLYEKPNKEFAKIYFDYAENLRRDSSLDFFLNSLCLYFLAFELPFNSKCSHAYFAGAIILNGGIFAHLKLAGLESSEKHIQIVMNFPEKFHKSIKTVFFIFSILIVVFEFYLSKTLLFLNTFSTDIFKVFLLSVGIFLLTKFYLKGTYLLSALILKKNELKVSRLNADGILTEQI